MEFTPFTVAVQIINFVLLYVLVLKPLVFKPLQTAMSEREQKVKAELDEAAKLSRDAKHLKDEYDAKLKDAAVEASTMVANGQKEGDRLKNELVEQGRKESQRLVEKANADILAEKNRAMSDIKGQVAGLSISMARQLLSRTLDAPAQQQIVERMLAQQGSSNGS